MLTINPDMSPQELLESFVPELIDSKLGDVAFNQVKDDFLIDVQDVGQWVARIEGGRPLIKQGSADTPLVTMVVSTDAIRMGLERVAEESPDLDSFDVSEIVQQMATSVTQEVLDAIRAQINGSIKFAVKANDGREQFLVIGFNGVDVDNPTCTVRTTEGELLDMAALGLQPQEAFMAGKIRFDGDMSIVMMLLANAVQLVEPGMELLKKYLNGR